MIIIPGQNGTYRHSRRRVNGLLAESGQIALRLPLALARHLITGRRYDDVRAMASISLHTAQRLHDFEVEARALNVLSIFVREVKEADENVRKAHEHLAAHRKSTDQPGIATALISLGMAMQQNGQFAEAILAFKEAATIFRETGCQQDEREALAKLSSVLREAGRFGEALATAQATRQASIGRELAFWQLEVGRTLRDAGQYEDAVAEFEKAATNYKAHSPFVAGTVLHDLGIILKRLHRLEEAAAAHKEAVRLIGTAGEPECRWEALISLGIASREAGKYEDAVTAFTNALAIHPGWRDALDDSFKQRDPEHWEFRMELMADLGTLYRAGTALENLSITFQRLQRLKEARSAHEQATAMFELSPGWRGARGHTRSTPWLS